LTTFCQCLIQNKLTIFRLNNSYSSKSKNKNKRKLKRDGFLNSLVRYSKRKLLRMKTKNKINKKSKRLTRQSSKINKKDCFCLLMVKLVILTK
jgi:hypothetical protein